MTRLVFRNFLRIVRGVLLKGMPESSVWALAWPIAAFLLVTSGLAMVLFRRRL